MSEHQASVLDHRFGAGEQFRLGVEEEFMLLDPETWDCTQHSDAMLAAVAAYGIGALLLTQVVEPRRARAAKAGRPTETATPASA